MLFPAKPTCHKGERFADNLLWTPAETGPRPPYNSPFRPFRHCSYCGSIHPEDLTTALEAGAALGGSDWKYGWPHKFYISRIPHPYEDIQVVGSSVWSKEGRKETWNPMGKAWGKWYNSHLTDEGFDDEAFDKLANLLLRLSGIAFHRTLEEGVVKLYHAAPRYGYQVGDRTLAQEKSMMEEIAKRGQEKLDGDA